MMPTLALLEAFDRHGALLARAPVTRWPVTVGRSLECDLVLDDPHVAPTHLRIDRAADAPRTVSVEVQHTLNGALLQRKRHASGERFDWPDGAPLEIGRTRIALRLADAPIAQELPLPRFPWRTLATTVALLALMLAAVLAAEWLKADDSTKYLKALPGALLGIALFMGGWAGLWAIANKVFDGHQQFWRHMRIACALYLGAEAVSLATSLAAFALSWEAVSRFGYVLITLVLAAGIYAHLAAVLPRRRTGLAWTVGAVLALGLPAWMGVQWLNHARLSNQLYMSSLFPPSLRVAPAVPVPQFTQEAGALRERLDRRVKADDDNEDEE